MNKEQQRIAIAELCGWTEIISTPFDPQPPKGRECAGANWGKPIPDYPNDLNAMHDAEKVLTGGLRSKYDAELGIIAARDRCFIWETTASQRAEAFLRAMGKWQE